MENRRVGYLTLISDLYLLLGFSFIIYGIMFGFDRIGYSSLYVLSISNRVAILMGILEIISCIVMAYLLHKCKYKGIRYYLIVICILNVIYRLTNITSVLNPLIIFMLFLNIALILVLIFYNK